MIIKLCLTMSLCLFPYQPIAKVSAQKEVLLVYGDQLSMVFLLEIHDHHISIYTLPMSLLLPNKCANDYPAPLAYFSDSTCLIETIEAVLHLHIQEQIYLHTEAIEQDMKFTKQAKDIHDFTDIQNYFDELAQQVDIGTLWHIHEYVDCDCSLAHLWDYYHIYQADDLVLDYYFLHLFMLDSQHSIALETQFYERKDI